MTPEKIVKRLRDPATSFMVIDEAADLIEAQASALRESLVGFEIIAGKRQCLDNLMGNRDVSEHCIATIRKALGEE